MGVGYSILLASPRLQLQAPWIHTQGRSSSDMIFITSLPWFPLIFVFCLGAIFIFTKLKLKGVGFLDDIKR